MADISRITLERYFGHSETLYLPATLEAVADGIYSMQEDLSSSLTLEAGDPDLADPARPALIVSASQGKFVVSALLDDDANYDLVGDSRLRGTQSFVLCGLESEYPRSLIVGPREALAAVAEFLHTRTVDVSRSNWESQQDPDNAWVREGPMFR